MRLKLATPLLALLPSDDAETRASRNTVVLAACSWSHAVAEVRARFPELADRVFTSSGSVAPGFILVVNSEVVPQGSMPGELGADDELALIPGLAGGGA
jgi:molybdopterin converting factor small subunit